MAFLEERHWGVFHYRMDQALVAVFRGFETNGRPPIINLNSQFHHATHHGVPNQLLLLERKWAPREGSGRIEYQVLVICDDQGDPHACVGC